MSRTLSVQKSQELLPGLCAGPHTPKHATCGGSAAGFLHTTHHHAKMGGLHDDTYSHWLQDLGDGQSHLLGETFLNLEPSSKHLCKTSDL